MRIFLKATGTIAVCWATVAWMVDDPAALLIGIGGLGLFVAGRILE